MAILFQVITSNVLCNSLLISDSSFSCKLQMSNAILVPPGQGCRHIINTVASSLCFWTLHTSFVPVRFSWWLPQPLYSPRFEFDHQVNSDPKISMQLLVAGSAQSLQCPHLIFSKTRIASAEFLTSLNYCIYCCLIMKSLALIRIAQSPRASPMSSPGCNNLNEHWRTMRVVWGMFLQSPASNQF